MGLNMEISLRKAEYSDCPLIHTIQVRSFIAMLRKYEDYQSSPAAEGLDQIQRRFQQPFTSYYLITAGEQVVGILRVCDFGINCRLSPICILPEFQGMGYGKKAVSLLETLYPKTKCWQLDTIVQEEKLCQFYEALGFQKTGKTEHLKEQMDLVFYEKIIE